ncbi:MAG: D-alanyl-D-alanine carboxypeptidase [SAR324 cluster bacterium]|nr:D-alanyl-D-alanine carboxypeptidase [SAR324 cluster bacterium]
MQDNANEQKQKLALKPLLKEKLPATLVGLATFISLSVTFFVFSQNGPEAISANFALKEDTKIAFTLRAKSKETNLTYKITKQPDHGKLVGSLPQLTYRPEENYHGGDHIEFSVSKGENVSSPAWISFNITPVNDSPKAISQKLLVSKNAKEAITLTAVDPDGDYLNYEIVQQPSNGTIAGAAPFVTYTPNLDFTGVDRFIFRSDDALSEGETATIELQVTPANQAPRAIELNRTTLINQAFEVGLQGEDAESDEITFEVVSEPKHGTLRFVEGKLQYQPLKDYLGSDFFHYIAKDKQSPSAVAQVKIQVLPLDADQVVISQLNQIITEGGVMVGSLANPEFIFHEGHYTPASLTKIGTAAAALHYLGFDHKFKTNIYLDGQKNLYIKGFGDPYFGSHSWHKIAKFLQQKGHLDQAINQVIIDATAFETRPDFEGRERTLQVYDAPLGALASNQNMGIVEMEAGGRITSVLANTPLTEKLKKKSKGIPLGIHRLAVAYTPNEGTHYSQELAMAIFKEYGMQTLEESRIGQTPPDLKPILVLESGKPLAELIRQMLHESNNYMANQLVMAIALKRSGQPAKLEEGVYLLNRFLQNEVKLEPEEVFMAEGSGLSRENHISLKGMIKLLEYFQEYKNLLPELKFSHFNNLAKAGKNTRVLAKTGTLHGVSNIAGYIYTDNEHWKPFVIMLNQEKPARTEVIQVILEAFH